MQAFILVADAASREAADDLTTYLSGALYSGVPWNRTQAYPQAGLNPNQIEPEAEKIARRFAQQVAKVSWGRAVSIELPPSGDSMARRSGATTPPGP